MGSRCDAGMNNHHVMNQADEKDIGSDCLPDIFRHLTLHLPPHHQPDPGQRGCLNICRPFQPRKLVTSHEKCYNIYDWHNHGALDPHHIQPVSG